ncbi:hypothetical protein LINPERPRIM_LOCUS18955 [Linum perenne]
MPTRLHFGSLFPS